MIKNLIPCLLLAAALASCATDDLGFVPYSTLPGDVIVTEVRGDGKPGQSWTVDGRTIHIDRKTDVLSAPGIPRPLPMYRTKPTP